MITVTSSKILVEEIKTKKKRHVFIPGQSPSAEWDIKYAILQIGSDVPKGWGHIKVGDTPIFNQYVQFASVKVLEKTAEKTVIHVIVDITDVIATDSDDEPALVEEEQDPLLVEVVEPLVIETDQFTANDSPENDGQDIPSIIL